MVVLGRGAVSYERGAPVCGRWSRVSCATHVPAVSVVTVLYGRDCLIRPECKTVTTWQVVAGVGLNACNAAPTTCVRDLIERHRAGAGAKVDQITFSRPLICTGIRRFVAQIKAICCCFEDWW